MTTAMKRLAGYGQQLPVRWKTAAVFAIAIAYGDGFWVTALQGTIGAIERNEPPLMHWLRDSTLMLPLVFAAVVLALLRARSWFARGRHPLVRLAAVALLIALVGGGVGIVEVAISSARDYSYQVQHLELMHSFGATQPSAVDLVGFGPAAPLSYALYCSLRGVATGSAVALMEYATLMVHVRALYIAALVLLATNLVIVTLVVALMYDRLWAPRLAVGPQDGDAASPLVAGGALS